VEEVIEEFRNETKRCSNKAKGRELTELEVKEPEGIEGRLRLIESGHEDGLAIVSV